MPTDTHLALPPHDPNGNASEEPERRAPRQRRKADQFPDSRIVDFIGNRFLFVLSNFGVVGVVVVLFTVGVQYGASMLRDMQADNVLRSRDDRIMYREEQERQRIHDERQRELTRKELELTRLEFRAALAEYRSSNASLMAAAAELKLTREALENLAKSLKLTLPKPKASPMSPEGTQIAPPPRESFLLAHLLSVLFGEIAPTVTDRSQIPLSTP